MLGIRRLDYAWPPAVAYPRCNMGTSQASLLRAPLEVSAAARRALLPTAFVLIVIAAAAVMIVHPEAYRSLSAAVIGGNLVIVALVRPRLGAVLTLVFLTVVALLRR